MNSKTKLIVAVVIAIAIIVLSVFILSELRNNGNGQNNENGQNTSGKTVTLTIQGYRDDVVFEKNDTTHTLHISYNSLDDGDTLILQGVILQITPYGYYPLFKQNVTGLSLGHAEWPIVIFVAGNVTGKYAVKDEVEITLHIKYYDIYQEYDNETWHIYGEFPAESILNGEYKLGTILVSPSQVRKISG